MLNHRKRERGGADDAENINVGGSATARRGAGLHSSSSNTTAGTAMQPQAVNTTLSGRSCSARPETCTSTAPTSHHGAGRAPRLANSAAAASSHGSSANASARNSHRSSGSALSASSTAARPAHGRVRPQPPSSSSCRSGAASAASTPSARGRGGHTSSAAAALHTRAGGPTAGSASASASAGEKRGSKNRGSGPTQPTEAERRVWATWRSKRERIESELALLTQYTQQLDVDTHAVEDAVEGMLTEFEQEKARIEAHRAATVARGHGVLQRLRDREEASLAAKQRALERIRVSADTVCQLRRAQEATEESIVLATDAKDALEEQVRGANAVAAERAAALRVLQQEEERMKDATYGLTGEVKELVVEMERLRKERHRAEVQAMEAEVARRELYSLCEELKGSIRVYCRVKGSAVAALPASAAPNVDTAAAARASTSSALVDDGSGAPGAGPRCSPQPSRCGSIESTSVSAGRRAGAGATAAVVPTSPASTGVPSVLRRAPGPGPRPSGRSTTRSSVPTTAMGAEASDAEAGAGVCVFSFPDRLAAGAAGASVLQPRGGGGSPRPQLASPSPASRAASPPLLLLHGTEADEQGSESLERDRAVLSRPAPTSAADEAAEAERGGAAVVVAADAGAGLPYGLGRAITIHQTRTNATSTGLSSFAETFTYDRVFTGQAGQAEVYRDVEPLVRNAVDGYRVCIFAYGQTGSGKTFTMEGDVAGASPDLYGVTPRALQTVLLRQSELAKEGWSYELSCTFVEIYNDNIRDLFQSGSARYEAALQQQQQQQQQQQGPSGQQSPPPASGSATGPSVSPSSSYASAASSAGVYHTIKHSGDRTHITNVVEKTIRNMDEFLRLYTQAVQQRSTAKTDLNDTSSRSHCLFTLHIAGTNATIRQRSEGVLCLIDLAGSERVQESGVHGKQFKEAVNINRSLLDLGKCIRALRCGAVVPWRNCKLTYLLQHYLGAKGAKLLMIVTVSNARAHAPESLNSLRFAARVQETYIGTSVRRVTSM